jgi:hypothetical protein
VNAGIFKHGQGGTDHGRRAAQIGVAVG